MSREKILVSACLLGVNCKYNGKNNKNEKLINYLKDKEVIPICPEIYGGLQTPRNPAEIIENEVITIDNKNVTLEYIKGAKETLFIAQLFNVKKAILKAKSPSCGNNETYDGTFSKKIVNRPGITAKLLLENGIKVINEEEIFKN